MILRNRGNSLLLLGAALLLAASVVGCQQGPPELAPPLIVDFRAVPTQITAGESATLFWNTTQADAISIDQGIGNVPAAGTKDISPATTTTYTLTVTNAADTIAESVTVTVSSEVKTPIPTPQPPTAEEITLADAAAILDLSSDLPPGFEELDATSEGVSNEDLGLGPDFSEVKVFLCEDPFNFVIAYMTIVAGRVQQAGEDAYLRDEEQLKEDADYWLDVGAAEEGMTVSSIDYFVTHPNIGDAAAIVRASIVYEYLGMDMEQEAEVLYVREEEAYAFVVSFHMGEGVSLEKLGEGIVERVSAMQEAL